MARNYRHLSLEECDTIMRMPVGRIAAELRRHPATIYRELRRNFFYDEDAWFRGYSGRAAHRNAASLRVCGGKVNRDRELSARISKRRHSAKLREQIIAIVREHYADLGPTLAREYR
ncbi:helix-turn-helix domain-containing protein [Novosphingobium sp.]|uniref:helix-turn-helix domain-containing protein n=1 Tax=Novosphingobium sp. TaxID=1874826 RepID=UPI002611442A|nr:helix-turn-helix domain-containing protein [Novosphingobium sp.]